MKLKLLLPLILLLATSCIRHPFELHDKNVELNAGKGIILCSVVVARNGGLPSVTYSARSVGATESFGIWAPMATLWESDFDDEAGFGMVKVFEVPAGEYEIFAWRLFYNLGMIQYERRSRYPFSIPFQVKADSINYLGQLTLEEYVLSFADKEERDTRIAFKQNKSLRGLPVVKRELKFVKGSDGAVEQSGTTTYPLLIPAK